LKSGEYKQGFNRLVSNKTNTYWKEGENKYHCCIGVLGEITEGLSNYSSLYGEEEEEGEGENSPYTFLENTIGDTLTTNLFRVNDRTPLNELRDYSNVIPLIEALEVQV
jgi:hypothetical protein